MEFAKLIDKLKKESKNKSLRTLAKQCEVSHEVVRKILVQGEKASITFSTCKKLEKGLFNK
jgi:DNA-binding Xre family transcriptional regulator